MIKSKILHLTCSVCGLEWDIDLKSDWLECWQDEETKATMCKEHLALAAGLSETSWRGNEQIWIFDPAAPDYKRYLPKADNRTDLVQLELFSSGDV